MRNKIIFITGGARSGKSTFVLNEANKIKGPRAYIATAEALDREMKERIKKHKKDRSARLVSERNEWITYEEPLEITTVLFEAKKKHKVVVIDCLTLWLSNIMARTPRKASQRGKQSTEPAYRTGRHRTQTTKARTQLTMSSGEPNTEFRAQIIEDNIKEFIDGLKDFSVCAPGRNDSIPSSGFCNLYVVSNEVGMGIVPDNDLAREFRDLAGTLNQKVAEAADEVYLVTAGIPVKIK